MSFTYEPAQLSTSPLYQVRYRLGDTDSDTASFQDEEIVFTLESNNQNITLTCIACISALLPRLARQTEFKLGPYSEKESSSAYAYWTKLLSELKAQATSYAAPIMRPPMTPALFHYNMMGVDDNGPEDRW